MRMIKTPSLSIGRNAYATLPSTCGIIAPHQFSNGSSTFLTFSNRVFSFISFMNLAFRSSPLIWPLKCANNSDILRPVAGTTARISVPVGKGTESSGAAETGDTVSDCFSEIFARHKNARISCLGGENQRGEDIVGRAEERKEGIYQDFPPDFLLFQVL